MDIEAYFRQLGRNCWRKKPVLTRRIDGFLNWFSGGFWRIPGNPADEANQENSQNASESTVPDEPNEKSPDPSDEE